MKLKQIRELIRIRGNEARHNATKCPVCERQILGKGTPISVYHKTAEGDNIPATIVSITGGKCEKFVIIYGNFLEGTKEAYVKANTLTLQAETL